MILYSGKFQTEIKRSAELLKSYYPELDSLDLCLQDSGCGCLSVRKTDSRWEIKAGSQAAFLRGFGHALADSEVEENASFEKLGIMLDCSRNKVHKIDFIKKFFCKIALMGYNFAMLYTEDVYVLEDEPLFGYMRGAFTAQEIRELDDFAFALGIELTACIQTLGHLAQILQYKEYLKCRDTAHVMMPESPDTFALIDKMLCFWKKNLRSGRIHIGMDETRDLGRGRYLDINRKYVDGYTLFSSHLNKMNELCQKHGLRPIIWSDMFFRLGNPGWLYYDLETVIPEEVKAAIPENIQLCYWDYYHDDADFYGNYISKHRNLGYEPLLGSGVWTWSRIWYDHKKTVLTALPGIAAGIKTGLKEIFFTMWGDNGGYCLYESALAGLEMCAGTAYGSDPEQHDLYAARCKKICGFDYQLYLDVSDIYDGKDNFILPEWIYWDDTLQGQYITACRNRLPQEFTVFYDKINKNILRLEQSGTGDDALLTLCAMYRCIKAKIDLFLNLNHAYSTENRAALKQISDEQLPEIISHCHQYCRLFRDNWLKNAKPFGLEVMQRRSAGMICRLDETRMRINEYLDGKTDAIDEIDVRLSSAVTEGNPFTACWIS